MAFSKKTVQKTLRNIGLKPCKSGKKTSHEVWGDGKGKTVELASQGTDVAHLFVKLLADSLQNQGLYEAREFKRLLRHI